MPPLHPNLRKHLESTVIEARSVGETAATAALRRLAVEEREPHGEMTPDQRRHRVQLRAKARQLGDARDERTGRQPIGRLVHEVAFEHWHRMLFARFLAENNLLIHPDAGVAVTLAECAELAKEESASSPAQVSTWQLAGRFAARMLPAIFRENDPALSVNLAPEYQAKLEALLASLTPPVFTADDSLGWVYQFWQSAEKDRVNEGVKSGNKINGGTLPAVTQLFTEHYMVLFLLHNTIGAWWAGRRIAALPKGQAAKWTSEAEARAAVALPGYSFDYLRFVRDGTEPTSPWRPAAGTFDGWPKTAKELKVLDPCCGSGHFLVAALELLAHLRANEEGLSAKDAAAAVIEDNLFGLELDPRCTQIAAFNVALAAWKAAGNHFTPPEMHIACSGVGPNCTQDEWVKMAEAKLSPSRRSASNTLGLLPAHGRGPVRNTLRDMHALFSMAPDLGSLIDPTATAGTLGSADWETVRPFLSDVMAEEAGIKDGGDSESYERAVAAQGMAKAAEILSGEYTLVITNVPYLGRGGQGDVIKAFCEKTYPEAKADLATVFVSRIMRWLAKDGATAVVTPQNWLFLTSYKKLRERLLKERTWNMVARLGSGAFETIGGAVVNVALITLSESRPAKDAVMAGIEASGAKTAADKARCLRGERGGPS